MYLDCMDYTTDLLTINDPKIMAEILYLLEKIFEDTQWYYDKIKEDSDYIRENLEENYFSKKRTFFRKKRYKTIIYH